MRTSTDTAEFARTGNGLGLSDTCIEKAAKHM